MAVDQFAERVLLAWQGKMEFNRLLEEAAAYEAAGQSPLGIVLYQTWLRRNASPFAHIGWFNLGAMQSNAGDLVGAEESYRQAITLVPAFSHPRLNLGLLYERRGEVDRAIAEWKWVADNFPIDHPESKAMVVLALNHLGRVWESRKQYGDALNALTRSLTIDGNQPDALHHWVYLREKQCAWPIYIDVPGVSKELMQKSTSALAMLNLSDDPAAQLAAARRFVEKKVISNVPKLANPAGYGHKKIRVGYLSSDFCLHPVSMLTVELLELHDREKFEVYGYCWSPEDGSSMRQRMIKAMDHFHRINQMSDEAAAQLIREHEIDILFDLQGQTSGARANLLAYRPAPVQITYLGLPATTGLPSIDYVVADRFLIPEDYAPYYSEKPLYLPDVYQSSDRQRVSAAVPDRASCGLPAEGFVFCSFNNTFKITPQMFDVWMRILKRVPNSVFWLLADNVWAQENLQREALVRGVDPKRLIFAGRVAPENYLARYGAADLFLDSFPFNAGTTANDALWMALPILTCSGRTFASRMAGALLTAAGLPELITTNIADYEEKAVWLANNPDEARALRARLEKVRSEGVLFDTPRLVRNLEDRLIEIAVNCQVAKA